jgi:hypothetical protein
MPNRVFEITLVNRFVDLDENGYGQASFTVSNVTTRGMRGRAKVEALQEAKHKWLSIGGEAERDFAPGATQLFTVRIQVPAVARPPAVARHPECAFRLNLFSTQNPDEDFTEGQTVACEVNGQPFLRPTLQPPRSKRIPAWMFVVMMSTRAVLRRVEKRSPAWMFVVMIIMVVLVPVALVAGCVTGLIANSTGNHGHTLLVLLLVALAFMGGYFTRQVLLRRSSSNPEDVPKEPPPLPP